MENIQVETVAIFVLLLGFLTTYILIPKLIGIIRYKNLMDHPDERSSHLEKTPTLGGVTFFISLIFGLFAIHFFKYDDFGFNIVVGVTILFFVGLKDDLMVLSAQIKIWAQLLAVSFVLMIPDLWITSFNGLFGIHEIPAYIGFFLSYLIMLFVVNAYNLIDGIDGLAGMLGILIFGIYGVLFYYSGNMFYFLLCVLSVGFLLAFLRFNLSKEHRIFMGDTGSLIVGFLISVLTIRFLAMPDVMYEMLWVKPIQKFLIVGAIIFFPVADVLRVIIMRLINSRGAFSPDRSHMHHILIDKGLTHKKASITLAVCGAVVFGIIFTCNFSIGIWGLTGVFILLGFLTFSILSLLDSDINAVAYRRRFKSIFPRRIKAIEFRIRKQIIIIAKKVFYKDLL